MQNFALKKQFSVTHLFLMLPEILKALSKCLHHNLGLVLETKSWPHGGWNCKPLEGISLEWSCPSSSVSKFASFCNPTSQACRVLNARQSCFGSQSRIATNTRHKIPEDWPRNTFKNSSCKFRRNLLADQWNWEEKSILTRTRLPSHLKHFRFQLFN